MMNAVDLDKGQAPRKKRCRNSKKKRLRLKKRASLEPKVESQNEDQDYKNKDDQKRTPDQDQNHSNGDELEGKEQEMTEYERKRRENILRNQAFMKGVGISIAKLAARTTIGDEAENEAKRQRLAKKREERAIKAANMPKQAQRLSLRIKMKSYSEKVRAKARFMAIRGEKVSLPANNVVDNNIQRNAKTNKEIKKSKRKRSESCRNSQKERVATVSLSTRVVAGSEGENKELNATKLYELRAGRKDDEFVRRISRMGNEFDTVHTTTGNEAEDATKIQQSSETRDIQTAQQTKLTEQQHLLNHPCRENSFTSRATGLDVSQLGTEMLVLIDDAGMEQKKEPEDAHGRREDVRHAQNLLVESPTGNGAENDTTHQKPKVTELDNVQTTPGHELLKQAAHWTLNGNKTMEVTSSGPVTESRNQLEKDNNSPVQQRQNVSLHYPVDHVDNTKIQESPPVQVQMTLNDRKRLHQTQPSQVAMSQLGESATKLAIVAHDEQDEQDEAKKQKLDNTRARRAVRYTECQTQPRRTKRSSRRLSGEKLPALSQSMDLGHPLDILDLKRMRQPVGSKLYVMDACDKEGKQFCKAIAGGVDDLETIPDFDKDAEYSLADDDTVKALPYRTTTLAFLPRADRVVIASGDKEGHVALWSPSTGAMKSSAALSRPHGFPVTHLIFPDSSTLLSSSIDGTVREFDLHAAKSSRDISDDVGITSLIGSGNPQFYYASCEDGTLRLVDRRARKMHSTQYVLHHNRINSVDQHPVLDFCIVTASTDATVCLWDKRMISFDESVPIARLRLENSIHCAHFSHDGLWLAAVGEDSYIDMYNVSNLKSRHTTNPFKIRSWARVPYNTKTPSHTKLRPAWDPRRKNQFAIGCLDHPTKLQIFRAGQVKPIHKLRRSGNVKITSADVVTVYHPHYDIIAGGNASGHVSLWRA